MKTKLGFPLSLFKKYLFSFDYPFYAKGPLIKIETRRMGANQNGVS
jgi:hypothetical protein